MEGEEGEEEEDEDDDDEDDEPDDSAKAMLRHKDDEYVPIDGERRKIGDDNPDDDEDEPTDVQGWRKLAESPSFLCGGMALRSYQLDGLNWLRLSYYLGRNVILGDEMGLGKTAQSVSMLQSLRSLEGIDGPFLIVAPLSTLPHWERELSTWTDMYWVNLHGPADSRRVVEKYEWLTDEKQARGQETYKFQVTHPNPHPKPNPNPSPKPILSLSLSQAQA